MDFNQTITIISVLITVVSIVIAIYQIIEGQKGYSSTTKGRRKALEGTWEGTFKQHNKVDGKFPTGHMSISLDGKGKKITGKGRYGGEFRDQGTYEEEIILKGGFRNDSFLVLDYYNQHSEKIHFGHYLLQLSPNGDQLIGKLVAFGNRSEQIISADISLGKV